MGTYNVGVREIIDKLEEALNDIEGDFSDDDLSKALTVMHQYPHTSNSKIKDAQWECAKKRFK